jgi:HlyD family secretion protein
MQRKHKKRILHITFASLLVIVVAFFASNKLNNKLPVGIVQANGRIEAEQIDISSKITGRVKTMFVAEGEMVSPNQILAVLDTSELNASLAHVQANLASSEESVLEGQAMFKQSQNRVKLAKKELARIAPLVSSGGVSRQTYDTRETEEQNSIAAQAAAIAHLHTLEKSTLAAKAQVDLIQSQIDDCTLRAPTHGRVLYRLAENSEVVGSGSPLLTIIDLSNVYMEVFLPALSSARLAIGAEARLKLDILPEYTIPASVVFVSPEAQFTPKQVETKSDRENLMFLIKLKVQHELLEKHIEKVKTGVRGDAYVQVNDTDDWPGWLMINLPDTGEVLSNADDSGH